jgi:hypothetical protein
MPSYKVIKVRKSVARPYTPPRELFTEAGYLTTPQRCGVLWGKLFSQHLGFTIDQETIAAVTRVPPRSQTRILASKQPRTLHKREDLGPDPRGRKRAITRSETAAIASYLEDPTTTLDNKGQSWLDLAESAGVILPKTTHIKQGKEEIVEPQTV